ncbi:helix-hairpin-helix motif protein, partial [Haloferax prahovense DSM 18310]
MAGDLGVRLLALRCDALVDATTTAIEDLVDYFDADLIYIVEEKLDMRTVSTVERTASCPVIYTRGSAVHTETVDG